MDIASHDDVVDSRKPANPALKVIEDVDPRNLPSSDARSPNCIRGLPKLKIIINNGSTIIKKRTTHSGLEIPPIAKKKEFDDGLSTMVNADFRPQPSPRACSNSENKNCKMEESLYKPANIEDCDIDKELLSHMRNTARVTVTEVNISTSPDESAQKADAFLKPAVFTNTKMKTENFNEAASSSLRISEMNIASYGDDVDLRPVKKEEEESDPLVEDACPPNNEVQPIVKEEVFDDEFGTMGDTGLGPSASSPVTSIFEKHKMRADLDMPVKIEECDIDENSLSHLGNTARVLLSCGNSSIYPVKYSSEKPKPASATHQVKKEEELDDNFSNVIHVHESPPPSSSRSSSFEKKFIKRKWSEIQSTSAARIPNGLSCQQHVNNGMYGQPRSVITSQSSDDEESIGSKEYNYAKRSSIVVNSSNENKYAKSLTIDNVVSKETKMTISTSRIVKNGKLNGNPLQCFYCSAVFKINDEFMAHIRSHNGYKGFKCDICQKCFVSNYHLQIHKKDIHSGELAFKCVICEERFKTNYERLVHELLHADEANTCPFCEQIFSARSSLKRHMHVHTGEKNYKCPSCEKSFSRGSYLNEHILSHTGERPYKCSMCEKSFRRRGTLAMHERTHSGARPFVCEICEQCFSYQCNLTRHLRTHTGEFKCSQCEMQFFSRFGLQQHAKSHTDTNSHDLHDVQQQPMDQSSVHTGTND